MPIRAKTDINNSRNLIIISVITVLGIGGMEIHVGSFTFGGIGLAGLVGIILNIVLPKKRLQTKESDNGTVSEPDSDRSSAYSA